MATIALRIWNATGHALREQGVTMLNVCYGKLWEGYVTKLYYYLEHIRSFPRISRTGGRLHVLLMDSDTFFSADEVRSIWERYDCARQGKDLVLSTEMSCWVGRHCTEEDVQHFYASHLSPSYSPFINAGAAMGTIDQLVKVLDYIVSHNYNYYISLPNGRTRFDDQYALADYFRSRANGSIALDHHQQLFGAFASIGYLKDYPNIRPHVCRNSSGHIVHDCFDISSVLNRRGFYVVDNDTCRMRRNFSDTEYLEQEMRTLCPK